MAARYHDNGMQVVDTDQIDQVVRTIVNRLRPRRIVLFGSHARGEAGPDSDLDLMVEMDTALKPADRAAAVGALFPDRLWPLDVVVYTPAEVARERDRPGSLLTMIESDGRTLYEHRRATA